MPNNKISKILSALQQILLCVHRINEHYFSTISLVILFTFYFPISWNLSVL
jgi:hypothetical protein